MAVTIIELTEDELLLATAALMLCSEGTFEDGDHQKRLTALASRLIIRGAMARIAERAAALEA